MTQPAEAIFAEMKRELIALEPVIAPVIDRLLNMQGELEAARRRAGEAGQKLFPNIAPGLPGSSEPAFERALRSGKQLEAEFADRGAESFAALRGFDTPEGVTFAIVLFQAALNKRNAALIAEYQEKERRERARREAARYN